MNNTKIVTIGLIVAVGLVAGLAVIPSLSAPNAQATDDGGHHKHKCKTGSGKDFPGRGPGGHCPPGLSKND